jgi:hypothetical protein
LISFGYLAAGDDLEKVVNDSNHVTQRKRCPRRKPRRRNKKNSNGIHNINRCANLGYTFLVLYSPNDNVTVCWKVSDDLSVSDFAGLLLTHASIYESQSPILYGKQLKNSVFLLLKN